MEAEVSGGSEKNQLHGGTWRPEGGPAFIPVSNNVAISHKQRIAYRLGEGCGYVMNFLLCFVNLFSNFDRAFLQFQQNYIIIHLPAKYAGNVVFVGDIKSCIKQRSKFLKIGLFGSLIFCSLSSHRDEFAITYSLDKFSSSVFDSLRELIYSEVASLISQNETRPHYLVELFRRLQLLTTDDQRRRVMATFEQLVDDYLTDGDDQPSSTLLHQCSGLRRSVSYTSY